MSETQEKQRLTDEQIRSLIVIPNPLPAAWSKPGADGGQCKELKEWIAKQARERREVLARRYGDADLPLALFRIWLHRGAKEIPLKGGRDAWAIVRAFDSDVAAWLAGIPRGDADAWRPLERDVSDTHKKALAIADEIRETVLNRIVARYRKSNLTEIRLEKDPFPAHMYDCEKIAFTLEGWAYTASKVWRSTARAWLESAELEKTKAAIEAAAARGGGAKPIQPAKLLTVEEVEALAALEESISPPEGEPQEQELEELDPADALAALEEDEEAEEAEEEDDFLASMLNLPAGGKQA